MNKGESFLVVLSTVFGGFVSYVNVNAAGAEQTWFDAGIAGYAQEQSPWPSDGTDKVVENKGTWSGTTNATYDTEHAALVVNAGTNALDFAAATTADAATSNVAYTTTIAIAAGTLVPYDQLPTDLGSEIKAGLAVALDGENPVFCGRAKDPDGTTNIWVVLTGAVPAVDAATSVRVLLKTDGGGLYAQYEVAGTPLSDGTWFEIATEESTLHGAKFVGSAIAFQSFGPTWRKSHRRR